MLNICMFFTMNNESYLRKESGFNHYQALYSEVCLNADIILSDNSYAQKSRMSLFNKKITMITIKSELTILMTIMSCTLNFFAEWILLHFLKHIMTQIFPEKFVCKPSDSSKHDSNIETIALFFH